MNRKSLLYRILLTLFVIQEKTKYEQTVITKRYVIYKRFNPYNPLTYILFLFPFVIGIIMFGFVGIWKYITIKDLKWSK